MQDSNPQLSFDRPDPYSGAVIQLRFNRALLYFLLAGCDSDTRTLDLESSRLDHFHLPANICAPCRDQTYVAVLTAQIKSLLHKSLCQRCFVGAPTGNRTLVFGFLPLLLLHKPTNVSRCGLDYFFAMHFCLGTTCIVSTPFISLFY